jgi:uncharacterized protein YukE
MDVGSPILGGAAIPGDPEGLRAIASRLQAARTDVESVRGRVAANGLQGAWSGSAAEAFRSSLDRLPAELETVASVFAGASNSINSFAGQLVGFQDKASYYANRIISIEQDLSAAQHRHDEAQTKVETARLAQSAASDPISLKTATDAFKLGLSLLRQAIDDLDENSREIARVRHEAQENREDYESAVRACCATLQASSEQTTHRNGTTRLGISGVIGGLAVLLQSHSRELERDAKDVYKGLGDAYESLDGLGKFVEDVLPVSMLGGWATPIVRMAENPVFRDASWVFVPIAAYGTFEDLKTTLDETQRENFLGRAYTTEGTLAADAATFWPPAAIANLADGGALSASLHGVALIGGAALSGGTDGAYNAYERDVRDRASGDYVGLARHVLDGAVSGTAQGALQGDDQFAQNAETGQYGGFVKDFAKGEDFVIEHPGTVAHAVVHAPVAAAKDLYHDGAHLLSDL